MVPEQIEVKQKPFSSLQQATLSKLQRASAKVYLGDTPPSEGSRLYLEFQKIPAGYGHVAVITRQTAHSK